MLTFATYFDSGFLVRGAACLRSLVAECSTPVSLVVLALDEPCAAVLPHAVGALPPGCTLTIHTLAEFEARHPELTAIRRERSRIEYYFTLTPLVCADALAGTAPGALMVYVDADMFCFADPVAALAEAGDADVVVTEHRFPARNAHLARQFGRFNVGWLAFRHTSVAQRCIDRWARQCIAWCSIEPDGTRFGDQKYLDDWPQTVASLAVLAHPGVNAAPWNADGHRFDATEAGVTVDGRALVAFHFHRLRHLGPWRYETDYRDYGRVPRVLAETVYLPYLRALEAVESGLSAAREASGTLGHGAGSPPAQSPRRSLARAIAGRLARAGRLFTGRRVVFSHGRVVRPVQALLGRG
jgi:hypothetical protein